MKKTIGIIGGGPAALVLAAKLNKEKFHIHLFERNSAVGRKFLVAGDGGFNLSHAEPITAMIGRYTPAGFLDNALMSFSNEDLRAWLLQLGIPTFVGTSNRIFPEKGIKPIQVLNTIIQELEKNEVHFHFQHLFTGWKGPTEARFETTEGNTTFKADVLVFALGGGSWKVTGSDGSWLKLFEEKGIETVPLYPSNCAYNIQWPDSFTQQVEGQSLKNISMRCGSLEKKGELVITRFGLEGGALYALSPALREQLQANGKAELLLDLKPVFSEEEILKRFEHRGNRSIRKLLADRLSFGDVQIQLLLHLLSKEEFNDPYLLAAKIKALPLEVMGTAPIDEAISTVGGISLHELNPNFELLKLPNNYCIGEMADWDAPTGGYLLQGCFSMGHYLAQQLNNK